jgi:O-antigen/teichoic acid export membrane protein
VSGLITGQLLSQLFANMRLLKNIIRDKVLLSKISKVKMIALAKRYKDFPKFSMWAALLNKSLYELIGIFILTMYSIATLGFYSLVNKVLGVPSVLIGNSIGQVFLQQASKEKHQTGRAINAFNRTVRKLFIVGIFFFGILFLISENLFAFVFGEEWRVTGQYAQILIPLFFIRFIVSTVSTVNSIFEKNLNILYIQMILLITILIIVFITQLYNLDITIFLTMVTYILSFEFLILYIYLLNVAKGVSGDKKNNKKVY